MKVLDFGGPGYLLFASGLTDLEYQITFLNISTKQTVTFTKPPYSTAGYATNGQLLK